MFENSFLFFMFEFILTLREKNWNTHNKIQTQNTLTTHLPLNSLLSLKESNNDSGEACPDNEWQCHNGECINPDFLCDGNPDCMDESDEDEVMCSHRPPPEGQGEDDPDPPETPLTRKYTCTH